MSAPSVEPFRFGSETLIEQPERAAIVSAVGRFPTAFTPVGEANDLLAGKRIALLSHPAGVNASLVPSTELLPDRLSGSSFGGARLTALLGPQHGIRGEKQDNMVESDHGVDTKTGLPVYSLYGATRRPTDRMIDSFDLLLVDLQDVGVRVYTFLTTLAYLIEDLHRRPDKELWVLDRPNPTGRAVEGLTLEPGHESFVGVASIPMQHGLTLGEFALWYRRQRSLATTVRVVPMTGWNPNDRDHTWPSDRIWIPPSPNMPSLATARCYPGTVVLEGTTLSEGRGTTRPLQSFGYPGLDWHAIVAHVRQLTATPQLPDGVVGGTGLRSVTFQPTFHKHCGVPTAGLDLVPEGRCFDPGRFRPFRLIAAMLQTIRARYPDLTLWTDPPYEYEYERRPIDVITGGTRFRAWIETPDADWDAIAAPMTAEEDRWREISRPFWLY